MLGGSDEAVPVVDDVLWWAADLGDDDGDVFGRHHLDGVPGADREFVRVGLLAWDVDADFAADAAFDVDLAPLLGALHDATVDRLQLDAIDRANLEAGFAAGAVVGVDHRQLFGNFLAWSFFGHGWVES